MNEESDKPSAEQTEKSLFWHRVKFLTLIAVFLSPFIGGWMALYVFELKPTAGNYGTLVSPVRQLQLPRLETRDGEVFESGFGRKWTLVLFAGDDCGEQCRSNLFYMRQLRTLLGRNTHRLQNVLVSDGPVNAELQDYLADFPKIRIIEATRSSPLYSQFDLPELPGVGTFPILYLVDPAQNLMMYFPAAVDQDLMLDDVKKLLKLSQIG